MYDYKFIQKINNINPHKIRYKRFDKSLPALYKDSERNAGFDLFARLDKPLYINPGEVVQIPLNIATEIPSNAVGLVFQRSSTYRKWGIKLTNNVGVIDSLFCGDGDEWKAEFKNETDKQIVINNGDKICQALFLPLFPAILEEVEELGNQDRGGFGTSFDNANYL
jgi:dUTP pyrophosphatase